MAQVADGMVVRLADVNWWYVLAALFGAFTLVSALGEWVFPWLADRGDTLSFLGLVATIMAAGFGASKADMRRSDCRLASIEALLTKSLERQDRMLELQERTASTVERQASALEEAVRCFRATQAGP